jgi:hypothetical protein
VTVIEPLAAPLQLISLLEVILAVIVQVAGMAVLVLSIYSLSVFPALALLLINPNKIRVAVLNSNLNEKGRNRLFII